MSVKFSIFKRQKAKERSLDKAIRKEDKKLKDALVEQIKELMLLKKRDELALTNRRKGMHLDNFDFLFQPSVDGQKVKHLTSCDFIRRCENILLSAPPGVGNIHLAAAIGVRAIEMGYSISYFRVEKLLLQLKNVRIFL